MEMTTLEKIERLQGLQQALEGCTRPCKWHTDPLSINDCWNWMRELLEELKDAEQSRIAAVSGSLPPDCYVSKKIGCHCVDKCQYQEAIGGNDR